MQEPQGLYTLANNRIAINPSAPHFGRGVSIEPDSADTGVPSSVLGGSKEPTTLVVALNGFGEAGHIVDQVREELLQSLTHERLATFDTDQLVDYRGRRPHIEFNEDHLTNFRAPEIVLYKVTDLMGKDFLLLTGVEPDYQWERFIAAVDQLLDLSGINFVAWVHGIPMPVPHTRPLGVTVHGNRADLVELGSMWRPRAELPSSVAHLMELRLIEAGRKVAGFAVHVPHYVADALYPPAAVTAMEFLGAATSLMLPTEDLRESGREVDSQIAQQMSESTEVQHVVANLEQRFDEFAKTAPQRSLLVKPDGKLADAEEIGAQAEAFLAQTDAEGDDAADSPDFEEVQDAEDAPKD